LSGHAKHGDAWQRQHLSGITPVDPPDPETLSGSPITAHMAAHISGYGLRFVNSSPYVEFLRHDLNN
jgi:hypothetical protein